MPLPRYGQQPRRFNEVRDLVREMDDLSSEEEELEEIVRITEEEQIDVAYSWDPVQMDRLQT